MYEFLLHYDDYVVCECSRIEKSEINQEKGISKMRMDEFSIVESINTLENSHLRNQNQKESRESRENGKNDLNSLQFQQFESHSTHSTHYNHRIHSNKRMDERNERETDVWIRSESPKEDYKRQDLHSSTHKRELWTSRESRESLNGENNSSKRTKTDVWRPDLIQDFKQDQQHSSYSSVSNVSNVGMRMNYVRPLDHPHNQGKTDIWIRPESPKLVNSLDQELIDTQNVHVEQNVQALKEENQSKGHLEDGQISDGTFMMEKSLESKDLSMKESFIESSLEDSNPNESSKDSIPIESTNTNEISKDITNESSKDITNEISADKTNELSLEADANQENKKNKDLTKIQKAKLKLIEQERNKSSIINLYSDDSDEEY